MVLCMSEKKKVLFVCLGNICRSPAAEGVLKQRLAERGLLDHVEVDSAGTLGYHVGELPDERMRAAAVRRGYDLSSRARVFRASDFDEFDLIVAMDQSNLADLRSFDAGARYRHKLRLLCDFIPDSTARSVPDPYYGGPEGFDRVLDMLERAAEGILTHVHNGREA